MWFLVEYLKAERPILGFTGLAYTGFQNWGDVAHSKGELLSRYFPSPASVERGENDYNASKIDMSGMSVQVVAGSKTYSSERWRDV